MARNFSLIPAGTTGRLPDDGAVFRLAGVVPLVAAASPSVDSMAGCAEPLAAADGCFERTGSISVLIWVRVNGPHKYDMAQRDSNTTGASSCTLFMRNTRLPSAAKVASISW